MMLRTRLRRDEGFSLTELIVVLALLGFVLIASYSALQLTNRATEIQRRDGYLSTSLTEVLQRMDVVLSQNISIDGAASGDYTLSCITDANADDVPERHLYVAGTDGTFVEEVYNVNPATGANSSLKRRTVWQRVEDDPPSKNANQSLAQPLFWYRSVDDSGTSSPSTPAEADMVEIRLYVTYDGTPYSDKRTIMFRNR